MKTLNSNEIVKVEQLAVKYKRNILIENVNLNIHKGEVIVLTGENGTGKTSLINYITGVKLSKNVKTKKDIEISFAPQNAFLKGKIKTIIEKYATMLNNFSTLDKVITSFSLEHLLENKYENISSGEQQRVKLAIAFLRKPDLIVLDEFTRGLDLTTTEEFINLIKNLNRKFNIAIVIVSHNNLIIDSLASKHYHISNNALKEVLND